MSPLQHARQVAGLAVPLAAILLATPAAVRGAVTTTVSSSWVIFPSEDVIYRYYPKYQNDHGIAGVVEINCRVRGRRDLDQCAVQSELPRDNGFGAAAVRMAQAEFHVLPEAGAAAELGATVSVRIDFTPRTAADKDGDATGAVPVATATGTDDPGAVMAWGQSIRAMDWRYAAPGDGRITFWRADNRLSPTLVRGAVRYEYYAPAAATAETVRSSVVAYEFDCAAHAHRPLSVTTYAQANLAGPARELGGTTTTWQKLVSGSVLEDAASRICQFDSSPTSGASNMAATSPSPSKQ